MIERLATMGLNAGRSDKVWMAAIERRSVRTDGRSEYRYTCWWGRRDGTLQTLRTPRPWYSGLGIPQSEYSLAVTKKVDEGYEHVDYTRSLYYDVRSKVRELAAGDTIPATRRTTALNPETMLPADARPVSHRFVVSTARLHGDWACGVNGCNLPRTDQIHVAHMAAHQFIRAATGFCVECRQPATSILHIRWTSARAFEEWSEPLARRWRANGSPRHEFSQSESYIPDHPTENACGVCARASTDVAHRPVTVDEWQTERRRAHYAEGDPPHQFIAHERYHSLNGRAFCSVCAQVETSTNHDPQRVWTRQIHAAWSAAGASRHIFIASTWRGAGGGVLCSTCGHAEKTTATVHIVEEKITPPTPVEYQPIVRRKRDVNF
jgi:hypothetical protein